jgi:hypothetical protein
MYDFPVALTGSATGEVKLETVLQKTIKKNCTVFNDRTVF